MTIPVKDKEGNLQPVEDLINRPFQERYGKKVEEAEYAISKADFMRLLRGEMLTFGPMRRTLTLRNGPFIILDGDAPIRRLSAPTPSEFVKVAPTPIEVRTEIARAAEAGEDSAISIPDPTLRERIRKVLRSFVDGVYKFIGRGGPGSGHRGHGGRPGEVGGSLPSGVFPPIVPQEEWERMTADERAEAATDSMRHVMAVTHEQGVSEEAPEYDQVKLTKTNINEYIKWSTSRYNEYKKKQVVDWSHAILSGDRWQILWKDSADDEGYLRSVTGATGDIEIRDTNPIPGLSGRERVEVKIKREVFSTGTYTPSSSMTGGDYLVNGEEGYIAIGHGTNLEDFEERERRYFVPRLKTRGGPGSGHFEHEGRPGEVGGSLPSGVEGGRRSGDLEIIGQVTTVAIGPYDASTYKVTDVIDHETGTYYVTDQIFKIHEDGYEEPLMIHETIAESWEPKALREESPEYDGPSGFDNERERASVLVPTGPQTSSPREGITREQVQHYHNRRNATEAASRFEYRDGSTAREMINQTFADGFSEIKRERFGYVLKNPETEVTRKFKHKEERDYIDTLLDHGNFSLNYEIVERMVWNGEPTLTHRRNVVEGDPSLVVEVRGPLRRIFIESARHSRSKCMECEQPPVVATHWANGHGMAWFCFGHFKEWVEEDERDIVGVWVLKEGECPDDIRKTPSGTEKVRKLGERISIEEINSRIKDLIERSIITRDPGGEGSGHYEHEGREGKVGGSLPGKGAKGAGISPERKKRVMENLLTPTEGGKTLDTANEEDIRNTIDALKEFELDELREMQNRAREGIRSGANTEHFQMLEQVLTQAVLEREFPEAEGEGEPEAGEEEEGAGVSAEDKEGIKENLLNPPREGEMGVKTLDTANEEDIRNTIDILSQFELDELREMQDAAREGISSGANTEHFQTLDRVLSEAVMQREFPEAEGEQEGGAEEEGEVQGQAEVQRFSDERASQAREYEPELTSTITGLAEQYGGELYGLEHSVKSEESLARKIGVDMIEKGITAEEAAAAISDANRYTMVFDSANYVEQVLQVQGALADAGWEQYDQKWKNFFRAGDGYDGYNTVMVNPETGQRYELQYHTHETLEINDSTRDMYEELRVLPEGESARGLELRTLMRESWVDYHKPIGWERLPGVLK